MSKQNLLEKYSSSSIACKVGCAIICTYQWSRKLHRSIVLFNVFSKLAPCSLSTTTNLFESTPTELANLLDSRCIADRSMFYSQEFSFLVATTLMGTSGHMNRKELEGPGVMEAYEETQIIFYQTGWYLFCTKLDGHHYAIAKAFAENFNGQWARVGNLAMQFTKESIATSPLMAKDGLRIN